MPIISGGSGFSSAVFAALTPTENFAQKRQDRQQELLYTEAMNKMEAEKLAKVQAMEDAVGDTATKAAAASAELSAPDAQRARQYIEAYTDKFRNEMADSGDPYKYFLKNGNNFAKKFAKDFIVSDVLTDGKLNKVTEAQYQEDMANGRYQREVKSIDPTTGEVIIKTPQQAYADFLQGKTRRLEYNGGYDEPDLSKVYQFISSTPNPSGLKTNKVSFDQFKMAVLASDDVKNKNMSPADFDSFVNRAWEKAGKGLNWNNNQLNYNYEALRTNAEIDKYRIRMQAAQQKAEQEKAAATVYTTFYEGDPSQGILGWKDVYNAVAKSPSSDFDYAILDRAPSTADLNVAVTKNKQGTIETLNRGVYFDKDNKPVKFTGEPFKKVIFEGNGIGALRMEKDYPDKEIAGKPMTIVRGNLLVDSQDPSNRVRLNEMFGKDYVDSKLDVKDYTVYDDEGKPVRKTYFSIPNWNMPYNTVSPYIRNPNGTRSRNEQSIKNEEDFGVTQTQFNKFR